MNNCTDDKLEPNDSIMQAYLLESGIRKLKLCPSDDDYFRLSLSYEDKLKIKINTSSVKTIPVYLFMESDLNNPIAYTLINSSGEMSLPAAPASGNYFVKVAASDAEINYEIEVEIQSSTTSCEDDIFEDNDSESAARGITTGSYKELVICPKDRDFFSLGLNSGDTIEINLTGSNLISEFYYNQSDTKKIISNTKNIFNINNSGTYFIRIYSATETTEKYSLDIKISGNSTCPDDGYEENDNPSKGAEIPLNRDINLSLCPSDDDWFTVKTYRRPTKITLKSDTNIPFEIYSPNDVNEPILYSDALSSDTEVAEFENLPDIILVRVPAKTKATNYSLKIDVSAMTCTDDTYEPNNSFYSARKMEAGSYNSLVLCPSDEDYYSFALNTNDRIEVEISFDNAKADIDIVLFDPLMKEVAYSITSGGTEKITHTAASSGNYILNVFAWDNGSAPYQMSVKIIRNQICNDDRFEDNDSINTATKLTSDEIYGLVICPSDSDYYSITLNKGDKLSTGVFYTESKGKLYSALLSSDGKTVFATGENQSGDIVLNITATYSGEYILLVRGADKTIRNDYDILIDIKRNSVCTDDIYEENDAMEYAPALAKGNLTQLVLCPLDTDYYKIYLSAKDIILAEVMVTNSEKADYTLTLTDSAGKILDTSGGTSNKKSLIYETASAGYYFINIRNNSNNTLNYSLSIQLDGSGGTTGDETIGIYPFDRLDKNRPAMYELKFSRVPQGAVVENLYLSVIVEHKSVSDIIITAQFSNTGEVTLWNGYGANTDKGFDDDSEDDADIELYNKVITPARGKIARDSLLIMIEDFSNTYGTIYAIEGRLFWKIK
ncbi:MAG: PPC domain-containing protein [Deltaproteobacteria bacterium]|nr:PPC domain-containing protein [Deltaproteobacteria bacterium]